MRIPTLILGCLFFAGCQSGVYKVTDVPSGRTYYAEGWLPGMYGRYKTIQFRDVNTGELVTLQSSKVVEVSPDEAQQAARKGEPTTRSSK